LPGGIPIPEIKLPKRGPKENPDEIKVTVAGVDGTLRRLREKDIVLQTSPQRLLRFRLLAKTQFRNKQGDPIRDSLLHPGDQLSIQVSPDDEETALRVILLKNGSSAERSAAERPFDEATVRAPNAEDLGKTRTVTDRKPADAESTDAASAEPGASPASNSGAPATDQQVLSEAREAALRFLEGLPNFLVQQTTSRYFSTGFPARWQSIDVVTAEVASVEGKEQYRDIKINGIPSSAPPERSGAWSTGEFSTTLADLFVTSTNASFKRRGNDKLGSRASLVFDFSVEQPNSHWEMVSPDGRRYNPPFEGSVWIDQESRRVLRIEQRTTSMPNDFPSSKAELTLDFAFVKIDQKSYLMPAAAESLGCMRGSGACTRNVIEFKNYRKFTADSAIKYE